MSEVVENRLHIQKLTTPCFIRFVDLGYLNVAESTSVWPSVLQLVGLLLAILICLHQTHYELKQFKKKEKQKKKIFSKISA